LHGWHLARQHTPILDGDGSFHAGTAHMANLELAIGINKSVTIFCVGVELPL
jgi:hypothetical protein